MDTRQFSLRILEELGYSREDALAIIKEELEHE